MRFSLRTLVILTTALPPVLAILWFAASSRGFASLCLLLGFPTLFALVVLSCVYRRGEHTKPMTIGVVPSTVLWWFQTAVLWIWFWFATGILGWMFVWGDNGPPLSNLGLHLIAVVLAAAVATATSVRNSLGLGGAGYFIAIFSMTVLLLLLLAPFFVIHLVTYGRFPKLMF